MSARDDEWRPGAVVGEYRLLRRLGAGGMGAVDLAEHVATGARRAIKSIVAPLDPELRQRFQREAEALAQVAGHPHVARVHSAGVAHGRPYLVMDHLPGGDLQERLRAGALPAREVARLGVALASGLAHVHACGVLHRDLKPANVLFDEQGRPVLVDFGLALPCGARSLTATGEALGTPAFMAPEQALGDRGALGPRTDVYGLGALLYAALTGRPPADGKSPVEVLTRVIEEAPPAPSSLVAGVPRGLEAVLLRALAKRPEQRFATMEELGAALAAALEARRGATAGRAVAVALALLALAVAGAVVAGRSRAGPTRAEEPSPARVTSAPPGPEVAAATSPSSSDDAVDPLPATVDDIGEPPRALPEEHIPLESRGAVKFLGALGVAEALSKQASDQGYPDDHELHRVAAQVFRKVAEAGAHDAARAWARLGRAFEHGFGVRRSRAEAVRCFEEASARGDMLGRLWLGTKLREEGRDLRRARRLLLEVVASSASDEALDARFALAQVALASPEVVSLQEALELLATVPGEVLTAERSLLRASVLARAGNVDDAVRACAAALDDPGYCGQAAVQRLELLEEAGRTEEAAAARADLARRALVQAGCAVSLARMLEGERRFDEAKRLYQWVAESEEPHAWNRMAARSELYRLCLRTGDAGAPVTTARARALLARERDGARLIEAAEGRAR